MRLRKIIGRTLGAVLGLLVLGMLALIVFVRPSSDRVWAEDQEKTAEVMIDGSTLTIKNLRDFAYAGNGAVTPRWDDATYDLRTLRDVWFTSAPFITLPQVAHTFLTFRFADGRAVSVSVEARRELGESYGIWTGILRQYETTYVWGTERDLLTLRVVERGGTIELYRLALTPDDGIAVLTALAADSERVRAEPEFYNTVTRNCTTATLDALQTRADVSSFDLRALLSSRSPELLRDAGLIASTASEEDMRHAADVTKSIRTHAENPDFSDAIREGL